MATTPETAIAIAMLSQPIKDIYESGKEKFKDKLSKWNNNKNILSLSSKIAAHEKIKTIWQREKYVKLTSFYYPSKIIFSTGTTKQIQSLKDVAGLGGIVFQGTVGQGKTVLLRYLCVQELKKNSSGRIPLFIELRKLESTFNIEMAVFESMKALGFEISNELFDHYADSGKIVLLLDGFDEIEESLVSAVITKLEYWAHRYPNLQVVTTCRPSGEIQKSSHFTTIQLAPLSPIDHKSFFKKIGVDQNLADSLLQAIEASPNEIKSLLRTPLLMTLLVLVYQAEGRIPNELPDFFKMLFTTVFSRHDRTKPGFVRKHKSGLNERTLESFFEAFCYAVIRRKYTANLKLEQFQLAYADAYSFSKDKCELDGFQYDIVKVACLLQEDGFHLSFIHKSLLDFFSAAFIKNRTDEQSLAIYTAINDQWMNWRATLQFLNHIDSYRFTKSFAIPNIQKTLSLLKAENGAIDANKNAELLDLLFVRSEIKFEKNHEGEFQMNRFGPYHSYDCFYSDMKKNSHPSYDLLINEIIEKLFHGKTGEPENEVTLSWKELRNFDYFNVDMIKYLNSEAKILYEKKIELEAILAEENATLEILVPFPKSQNTE